MLLVPYIIAFYFAMVFGVSWLTTRRKDHDMNTFYRGDRKSPWWVVAIAMVGTSISGVTYLSTSYSSSWGCFLFRRENKA